MDGNLSADCTSASILTCEARMIFITRVMIVPLEPQCSIISSHSLLLSLIGWLPPCYSFRETGIWLVAHVADTCTAAIVATRRETKIRHVFFFFFIWGKCILSETPSFHDLPPFLHSEPQRKCILWQPFHLNSWSVSLLRSFDVFGVFWFHCIAPRWFRAIPAC